MIVGSVSSVTSRSSRRYQKQLARYFSKASRASASRASRDSALSETADEEVMPFNLRLRVVFVKPRPATQRPECNRNAPLRGGRDVMLPGRAAGSAQQIDR